MEQLAISARAYLPRHDTVQRSEPAPPRADAVSAPKAPPPEAAKPKPAAEQHSLNVEIDTATGTVIFQTISEATGSIVSQYPNDAQLNLRAYLAGLELAAGAGSQGGN